MIDVTIDNYLSYAYLLYANELSKAQTKALFKFLEKHLDLYNTFFVTLEEIEDNDLLFLAIREAEDIKTEKSLTRHYFRQCRMKALRDLKKNSISAGIPVTAKGKHPILKEIAATLKGKHPTPKGIAATAKGKHPALKGIVATPKGKHPAPKGIAATRKGKHPAPEGIAATRKGKHPAPKRIAATAKGKHPAPKGIAAAAKGKHPAPKRIAATAKGIGTIATFVMTGCDQSYRNRSTSSLNISK
jgi:hypothetical protein